MASPNPDPVVRQPIRRVTAYLIDYGIILIWIALLVLAAEAGWIGLSSHGESGPGSKWIMQGQAFLFLTLPVYLYFTLMEAFGRKATVGKRALHMRVIGSPTRIVLRNFMKFLPWELAHTGIWHGMTVPFQTDPTPLGYTLLVGSLLLSSLYFISLFSISGRTLYDRISGTRIVRETVRLSKP